MATAMIRGTRFQVINATASSSSSSSGSSGRKLIQSGTVRAIPPREAHKAMSTGGYVLLDVRPVWEREKASAKESVHVPIFVEDKDGSVVTLVKKWIHFGYIGLWTGQYLTTINPDFLSQVEMAIPSKDTNILVACGEGLRSMIAIYLFPSCMKEVIEIWDG